MCCRIPAAHVLILAAFIDNLPCVASTIRASASLVAIIPAYAYIWLLYGIH